VRESVADYSCNECAPLSELSTIPCWAAWLWTWSCS